MPTDQGTVPLSRHLARTLGPPVWAARRRVLTSLGLLILAKLVMVAVPMVLKVVVDELSQPSNVLVLPVFLLIAYALLRFLGTLFNELRDVVFSPVLHQVVAEFNERTFAHLHRLGPRFHVTRQTGSLARDVERGTAGITFLLGTTLFTVLPTLFEIVVVAAVLAIGYDIGFTIIVVLALLGYGAFTFALTERRAVLQRAMNAADSATSGRLVDTLLNYETVKFYTNEHYELVRFRKLLKRWRQTGVSNQHALSVLHIGQSAIIAVGVASVMLLAGREVALGNMTVGSLVLVNAYIIQISLPLNTLGMVFRQSKDAVINAERLFSLLATPPEIDETRTHAPLQLTRGEVRFESVDFSYEPGRQILWNVDFRIPPGATVAVVGGSGSGKSTLARLLFRFYDPDSGRITIDDQALNAVDQKSLRAHIGMVPQDTALFNETVAYNIAYGRPGASMAEIIEAARAAHIHEFINALPAQYDTMVGERGVKLSGGERQRIAIARAILKNPPILIFDEATSALDTMAERAIQNELAQLSRDRTTLIIAHRLSTVVDADEILVLDQGRIVERGTHEALLASQGIYAQMWNLQLKQSELERTARRLSKQPVNMVTLVASVLDGLRPLIEERSIELYTFMGSQAYRVTGDPSTLQQVVSELCMNAIAVSPPGGRMELRLDAADGNALLSITDGRDDEAIVAREDGIESALPMEASTIFDPMHIRALVEGQGGKLLTSVPPSGRGETRLLSLPLRAVASEAAGPDRTEGGTISLAGISVMVVDDQADVLEQIGAVLETYDASVLPMNSGKAALEHLTRTPSEQWPDVLLCDLSLGDEDGHQVLQEIRSIESQRATALPDLMPAVALTGRTRPMDRMRALLAGFQVHLAKPVEPAELAGTIATLARVSRPPRASSIPSDPPRDRRPEPHHDFRSRSAP
ncbi:MAG: ATP-binding cassette domain-containing protein [Pigmentiphaga sp.]|uniref:ATP-binding cassette domain-containing protein n=1 Tax=Pigmentiphaga sp. TaxID=1977564 RepID=UPI0029BA4387|nr:ATP-binding cassette domain-containing protein [Pigmentiphaga sp.]MDX3907856.1 ATP-binding cassette domain-containing protein [Pigmentiphaga sp.]